MTGVMAVIPAVAAGYRVCGPGTQSTISDWFLGLVVGGKRASLELSLVVRLPLGDAWA